MKEASKTCVAMALLFTGLFCMRLSTPVLQGLVRPGAGNDAAVFMVDNVSVADLHTVYDSMAPGHSKVRIFIMPGHEPDFGGAEYRDIKERDLNLVIAGYLREFLSANPHFNVVLGRDENGWNPSIAAYFRDHEADIQSWHDDQKRIMAGLVDSGQVKVATDPTIHQVVSDPVAMRLYGLNKWIGENNFDLALHVHINDYGSRDLRGPGMYSGFTIYVPDHQYSNYAAASAVASAIKKRLSMVAAESDAPKEQPGIVEDQQLIALGRYNTADAPSMLIEYGYIYEPQFRSGGERDAVLKEYAYQTYLGILDFFASSTAPDAGFTTAALPHEWVTHLGAAPTVGDVFSLQVDLLKDGAYPPKGRDLHDCPLSGGFGPCTKAALSDFQKKYGIGGEAGVIGSRTRTALDLAAARIN